MSLVSRLPLPFGTTRAGSAFANSGISFDYALGGIGLLAATGEDAGYQRMTAPYRKEQTDQSTEPGEQSLQYWWLRSQLSFHGGAGRRFIEPSEPSDTVGRIMFESSQGVDVWTPGAVSLLKRAELRVAAAGAVTILGAMDGTSPILLQAEGTTLSRVTATASTPITWGGTGTILSLASDGTNYYAADSTGIYRGTLAGGNGALIWNTGSPRVTMAWAKQRLVAAIGASVYELTGAGPTLPAAKYTHPNPDWLWTDVAEGPNQILMSGFVGDQSAVLSLRLNDSGGVPVLTSATTVAQLPTGEQVHAVFVYLGRFVILGTTVGARVGVLTDTELTYGPPTFEVTGGAVRSLVGQGSFVYCGFENGIDGKSGLARIDLSSETAPGRYAYATDLQAKQTGLVRSVALLGDRLAFTVDGFGSYLQSATLYESAGSLTTSRIRMSTLEPKLYKFLKLRTSQAAGLVGATVADDAGRLSGAVTGTSSVTDIPEVQLYIAPAEFVQITIRLEPTQDGLSSPELQGYQLKALPAQKRQRMEVLSVLLYDFESDRHGQRVGHQGYAISRLQELEAIEEASDIVLLQHLRGTSQESISRLVVIDQLRFRQQAPPAKFSGWGGVVEIVLRSVT